MSIQGYRGRLCDVCPSRTPFRADPETIRQAQELQFNPPLDEGIREIVLTLVAQGIETFESCQGGDGHGFPEPTVRFEGGLAEGPRAVAVAIAFGFPIARLRRTWGIKDGMLHGPWWELTFTPPRPSSTT
jgi:hypothetical protein